MQNKSRSRSGGTAPRKSKRSRQQLRKEKEEALRDSDDESVSSDSDSYVSSEEDEQMLNSNSLLFDFTDMVLKEDHEKRPLWLCPNAHVFLETFSSVYQKAYDFLIAIAEPLSRPMLMHEYVLTPYSLYAAVSVGLKTEDILWTLDRLSKVQVSTELSNWISQCTSSVGKVQLVLQNNRYFLETKFPDVFEKLLQDKIIQDARKMQPSSNQSSGLVVKIPSTGMGSGTATATANEQPLDSVALSLRDMDKEEGVLGSMDVDGQTRTDETSRNAVLRGLSSTEIDQGKVEAVRRRCIDIDLPTVEEYDYRKDMSNQPVNIDLKSTTGLRAYQETSLSKVFGNGRARSGIIVLPCGAGKTLVGVTTACTLKKPILVLCTSAVSVEQWRQQFKLWSTATDDIITRFTSYSRNVSEIRPITITTYTMIAFTGRRSRESEILMKELQSREWGLLILDEVHVVPARMFRRVTTICSAHCKLGLTATLVREDDRITDLNYLIGPKLYEANWLDLVRDGHIANVLCAEVWCQMTQEFQREYLKAPPKKRMILWAMNPNKIQICEYLVRYHEARGDKVIVFSDNVYALIAYAKRLRRPFIYGPTSQVERMRVLHQFQVNPDLNCIFISKVGDTSIDLPDASVIIQISSHYGSRRQEAQRLGRILRPKARIFTGPGAAEPFNAFFYSLVSRDTQEMFFSHKRQQFLVDQGYSFKVITKLQGLNRADLCLSTKQEQLDLLREVMSWDLGDDDEYADELAADMDDLWAKHGKSRSRIAARSLGVRVSGGQGSLFGNKPSAGSGATRRSADVQALSGVRGVGYFEYDRDKPGDQLKAKKARNKLFADRYKKK